MQIKKSIIGKDDFCSFPLGEMSGYNDKFAVEFLTYYLNDFRKESTIFFIGRYMFDAEFLKANRDFSCQYNNVTGFIDVKYCARPDLNMSFLTTHKSKGLQADYIIYY